MADAGRGRGPGRSRGRGRVPAISRPFNGHQNAQNPQNANNAQSESSFPAQSSGFPVPSQAWNQPSQAYQQPSQTSYQQPNQSSYQQPVQSSYQQPNQSAYQQPSFANPIPSAQSSYAQPNQMNYQQPLHTPYQPGTSQPAFQQGYGGAAQPQFGQQGGGFQTENAINSTILPSPAPQDQGGGFGGSNDLMTDFATGVLRSQGENYFHRGQAYVQSKMGFLSAGDFHYLFDIDGSYVLDKLMLLLLPFFGSRSFARKSEQISGGHRYQPPRKDVFAPDLYIPFMAICTYVVLLGVIKYHTGNFSPDNMYLMGSSAVTGWLVQWVVIKTTLYFLAVSSGLPVLEILAYAGYPFFYACLGSLATLLGGVWPYRVILAYGTLAMATFLIRTMKHVLFQDSPRHGSGARYNYILLGLGAFQLPFLLWFHA